MYRVFALILVGAALIAPQQVAAQTEWEQQVLDQIRAGGMLLSADGYQLRGSAYTGSLNASSSDDFSVRLEGGVTYTFLGVCDADCEDIDLSIADSRGETVDSDYQEDDVPMLEVTPDRTGEYNIHVYMANCSAEPCYYGVGTFEGEAGPNEWEDQVRSQILTAGELLSADGFSLRGEPHAGSLGDDASEEFTVLLQKGVNYALVGVCDVDCSDIDLMILDESGNELISDYLEDDVPVVELNPRRSGTYRVHVYMASCAAEPCYYGVGTFVSK